MASPDIVMFAAGLGVAGIILGFFAKSGKLFALGLAALLLAGALDSSEFARWQVVQEATNQLEIEQRLESYLRDHPEGDHFSEARANLVRIKRVNEWVERRAATIQQAWPVAKAISVACHGDSPRICLPDSCKGSLSQDSETPLPLPAECGRKPGGQGVIIFRASGAGAKLYEDLSWDRLENVDRTLGQHHHM